ncbi:hypothetical protein QZH41_013919 [Actinostola sp. cb2023]|nr:hypothetical protein QZH41_013919 [Actinostola sp. cb2023]
MSNTKRDTRATSRQPADISHELRKWALDEMGFRPQGRHVNEPLPTTGDFKLLSRGAMVDVWEFVVKHVKSTKSDNASHLSKDQLWSHVEAILNKHSSQNILSSLVLTTQDLTTSLKELTTMINLKRDAEQLKFLYQKGKLTDTSQPPSLLQSVHQLIEEGQAQHVKCFVDAERASNEAWKLHKELQALSKDMENRMDSRYKGLPGSADLSRTLYHSELELAASKDSLAYLQSAIKDLENSRREKLLALETIQSKYNKIKDFEKLAQTKQSVIQALVKQNFAARTNLEKQNHELLHYIQSKVCPHEAHIVALATGLRQAVSRDIDKFVVLPITRLQHVNMLSGERIAADDLSIYRLEGLSNRPGGAAISQVLDKLDFPLYKAPEELLPRILEIKDTCDDESDADDEGDVAAATGDDDESDDESDAAGDDDEGDAAATGDDDEGDAAATGDDDEHDDEGDAGDDDEGDAAATGDDDERDDKGDAAATGDDDEGYAAATGDDDDECDDESDADDESDVASATGDDDECDVASATDADDECDADDEGDVASATDADDEGDAD